MRRRGAYAALILGVLALSGCSGGVGNQPLYPRLAGEVTEAIAAGQARRNAPPRPQLTRAALNQAEGSFVEATLERSGIFAYLYVAAIRHDDDPGQIVQWRTEDEVTLTTRNGVLIATRGLGGDVISSAVHVAEGVPGPVSGGAKVMDIRTGNLGLVRLELACDLVDLGPDPVVIVEQRHPTRHLQERCTTQSDGTAAGMDGGEVVNDYWVDSAGRTVWQSVQWAGPYIGYVKIRRLK